MPIHYACDGGHLDTVKLLISKGSDFTSTNDHGNTPLLASIKGHTPLVDYLIQRGADVNCRNKYGYLPLHHACLWGYLHIVKLLLSKGSDFTSTDGSLSGHTSLSEYPMQCGAEVNCRDNYGSLPIHNACRRDYLHTVRLLISKGSDFTSTDNDGDTPLHLASMYGHRSVVDYLKQRSVEATGN